MVFLCYRERRQGQAPPLNQSDRLPPITKSLVKSHQQAMFDPEARRSSHAHISKRTFADGASLTRLLPSSHTTLPLFLYCENHTI